MHLNTRLHLHLLAAIGMGVFGSFINLGFFGQAQAQSITSVVFQTNFEDGPLPANVTIQTVGNFTTEPGIKATTYFGSTKAFGFGKTDCAADCWYDNTTTLRIQFTEAVPIAVIYFDEAEVDGNWGSTGYVRVDGQVIDDGIFERLPWNDGVADTDYRHHALTVNRWGYTVEFKVIDITSTSEMFIDNIVIVTYPKSPTTMEGFDFEDSTLPANFTWSTKGTFTKPPQFYKPALLEGRQGFSFGRSTCNSGAWWDYTTTLEFDLGKPTIIEYIFFSEAELETNWGNQGLVLVDGHEVPHSVFGRLPSNDFETDCSLRTHYIPVHMVGRKVAFTVWDITDCGEIIIDYLGLGLRPLRGEAIFSENFEDNAMEPQLSAQTIGNYIDPPGIKSTGQLSGGKAYGFGRSDCAAGCYEDYQSSLTLFFPKGVEVSSLRFQAMELFGNWGAQGRLYINGQFWPSLDFARQPSNDLAADTTCRRYDCWLNMRVYEIKWTVWDISTNSEVFIDNIELIGAQTGAVQAAGRPPEEIELLQNYPNPFNASTVISFTLRETAQVRLTIFNAQGQIVEQRDLGRKPAGCYQEVWDAQKYAGGTYFCRLETPTLVKTTQMVLLR